MPTLVHVKKRAPSGMSLEQYFWYYVDKNGPVPKSKPELGPCWIWTGNVSKEGYGRFGYKGVNVQAHVFAWHLLVDAEAKDFVKSQRDHLCRVRKCVNPSHMEEVTRKENILRGECPPAVNARKIQCKHKK